MKRPSAHQIDERDLHSNFQSEAIFTRSQVIFVKNFRAFCFFLSSSFSCNKPFTMTTNSWPVMPNKLLGFRLGYV